MGLRRVLNIVIATTVVAGMAACGEKAPENNYVVEVDGHGISKETILQNYRNSSAYRNAEDFTEEQIRHYIEDKWLGDLYFLAGAYDEGLHQDSAFKALMDREKKRLLTRQGGALYHQVVPDSITVTDAAIRDLYNQSVFEYKIADIWLTSKARADSVYEALQKGADFATMARRYSADRRSAPRGGEVPIYFKRSQLGDALGEAVQQLEVGAISKPTGVENGFHIVKLLDKRSKEQKPFQQVRRNLEAEVRRKKQNQYIQTFLDSLVSAYQITINESMVEEFLKAFRKKATFSYRIDKEALPPEIRNNNIVEFRGGAWSVTDAAERYNESEVQNRMEISSVADFKDFVHKAIVPQLMYHEALHRGIDTTAAFRKTFQEVRDQKLIQYCKETYILDKIRSFSEEKLRAFYTEHSEQWPDKSFGEVQGAVQAKLRLQKRRELYQQTLEDFKSRFDAEFHRSAIKEVVQTLKADADKTNG